MSQARGFPNAGHFYSNIVSPVKIDLNFIVDVDNTNGLGIRSLKSNGFVRNVFMHTSATPGSNDGYLNPNPASGLVLVQLKQNFNKYISAMSSIKSPNSGSNVLVASAGVVTGLAYVISVVGTTTAAGWQALGLPVGVTAAVGVAFIAKATTTSAGTGAVQVQSVSGISCMEVIGLTDSAISYPIDPNGGQWFIAQLLGATAAGNTALIPKAPAEDSIISLSLCFDNSSVTVDGL